MSKLKVPELPSHSEIGDIMSRVVLEGRAYASMLYMRDKYAKPYRDALVLAVEEIVSCSCECSNIYNYVCDRCKTLTRIDALLNKDKEGEGK